MNLVLYHGICTDGFTCALLMHLYFKATGQEYEMLPVNYKEPLPTNLDGKHIYVVDFCYPKDVLADFAKVAKSVTVLDHHLTAAQEYGGYGEYVSYYGDCPIDVRIYEEHSGASLVYKYLSEIEISSNPFDFLNIQRLRDLVRAVRDYDLWFHEFGDTKIIHDLLQTIPRTIDAWIAVFLNESEEDFSKRVEKCRHYYNAYEALAATIADTHKVIDLCGYRVPIVNSPHVFADRICEHLYHQDAPFAISFVVNSKELYCSLRSKREGGVDVSEIAKKFGGGGHATSAAFKIPPYNLPKLLSGKLTPQPCLAERIMDRIIAFLEQVRYSCCKK